VVYIKKKEGGEIMITNFGKFCRRLRIDNGELLYDMAKKLGVSSAFMSSVENGKKNRQKNGNRRLKRYIL
jgi:transcriptional regulator with XRE-family HTH domain